jgi:hypothetical protein
MPVLGIFGHAVNIGPSAARENNLGSDGLMLLPVERLSATHRTVRQPGISLCEWRDPFERCLPT